MCDLGFRRFLLGSANLCGLTVWSLSLMFSRVFLVGSGLSILFALPTAPPPVPREVCFVLAIVHYDEAICGVICECDRWFYFYTCAVLLCEGNVALQMVPIL